MKCEEAGHVCDKNQYKEATLWEKIKLNIHLLYCNACRKYAYKNDKLTDIIKKSKIRTISKDDKKALKEKMHQETSK